MRMSRRWRPQLNEGREHDRRRSALPQYDLPNHGRGRDGRTLVVALVAVEGRSGRQQMTAAWRPDRLHIHTRRPDALPGFGFNVQAHHRDREEGGRSRRGKLDRQMVLQHAVGPLHVAGH